MDECRLLFELMVRVFSDESFGYDAVWLAAETEDNMDSVIQKADMILEQLNGPLLLLKDEAEGYPGGKFFIERYSGNIGGHVRLFPRFDGNVIHTFSEAKAFVKYAGERPCKKVGVIAPPFHLLRAFISAVSAAKLAHRDMDIYGIPEVRCPGTRKHFIARAS